MICPSCKDGFVSEPIPKPLILSYRGFERCVDTQLYLACSNCLYEATEPLESIVDIEAEMISFQREINIRLSTEDQRKLRELKEQYESLGKAIEAMENK